MKKNFIFIFIIFILFVSCSSDKLSLIENKDYLIKLNRKLGTYAQKNQMWKEAVYRWKRVVNLNPNDYKAHNNLAIAYEALGEYQKAEIEYKLALSLSHNNEFIRSNYEKFKSGKKSSQKKQHKKFRKF